MYINKVGNAQDNIFNFIVRNLLIGYIIDSRMSWATKLRIQLASAKEVFSKVKGHMGRVFLRKDGVINNLILFLEFLLQ